MLEPAHFLTFVISHLDQESQRGGKLALWNFVAKKVGFAFYGMFLKPLGGVPRLLPLASHSEHLLLRPRTHLLWNRAPKQETATDLSSGGAESYYFATEESQAFSVFLQQVMTQSQNQWSSPPISFFHNQQNLYAVILPYVLSRFGLTLFLVSKLGTWAVFSLLSEVSGPRTTLPPPPSESLHFSVTLSSYLACPPWKDRWQPAAVGEDSCHPGSLLCPVVSGDAPRGSHSSPFHTGFPSCRP